MVRYFEDNLSNLLRGQPLPKKRPNTPAACVESDVSKKENEFEDQLDPQKTPDKEFITTNKVKRFLVNKHRTKIKGNSKWKTDLDLPPGWKWKTYKTDPVRERRMLLSPEQKRYLSIYSALRQMQRMDGKEQEVGILSKLLTKDGWFSTELLPVGYWLKQKRSERSFLSLTPTFDQLRTMRELFDHLRFAGHSDEMVAKIQNSYRYF